MSTPRTDHVAWPLNIYTSSLPTLWQHARDLERDLREARELLRGAMTQMSVAYTALEQGCSEEAFLHIASLNRPRSEFLARMDEKDKT